MKLRVRGSFVAYLGALAVFASPWACLGAILALAVHEGGHLVISTLLREPVESMEFTPFGGVMTYAAGRCASKGLRGLALAAAGPMANYAMLCLLPRIAPIWGGFAALHRELMLANAAMLLINLLPALPLDGGRMLFSAGYYVFGVSGLIRVLTAAGVLCGSLFILLCAYGVLALQVINLSMLLVGTYLIVCAIRTRTLMLADNLFTVVQERHGALRSLRRVHVYAVPDEVRILSLLEPIGRSHAALFLVQQHDGTSRLVREETVLSALLAFPQATAGALPGIVFSSEETSEV